MPNKNEKAAVEMTSGKSVQTNTAASAQEQPTTLPDGTTCEIASLAVGTEATTTLSQSITAAETQVDGQSPDVAGNSAGTNVPAEFRFTETDYEPSVKVNREELSKLSQNDLLTGLRKQYSNTNNSFCEFRRDISVLVAFYDEVVERYRDERVSKNRNGKPTLQEAFSAVGWNYEAARKMRQRYNATLAGLPAYSSAPKPLQLVEGDKVKMKEGDGTEGVVTRVDTIAPKVDVVFDGTTEPKTIPIESLAKAVPPVKKVRMGDRILCEDNGSEYQYAGHGKFVRTETPTLLEQKHQHELATIKLKEVRERAKAEEKKHQKELRQAEAARRDLKKIAAAKEKIAAAKAEKDAARQKKTEAARRVQEKREARLAEKAARKAENQKKSVKSHNAPPAGALAVAGGVAIGDRSEPTARGHYWEFRKHDKFPYIVRNLNHSHLGILVECPSKVAAEMKIQAYEQEAV